MIDSSSPKSKRKQLETLPICKKAASAWIPHPQAAEHVFIQGNHFIQNRPPEKELVFRLPQRRDVTLGIFAVTYRTASCLKLSVSQM